MKRPTIEIMFGPPRTNKTGRILAEAKPDDFIVVQDKTPEKFIQQYKNAIGTPLSQVLSEDAYNNKRASHGRCARIIFTDICLARGERDAIRSLHNAARLAILNQVDQICEGTFFSPAELRQISDLFDIHGEEFGFRRHPDSAHNGKGCLHGVLDAHAFLHWITRLEPLSERLV